MAEDFLSTLSSLNIDQLRLLNSTINRIIDQKQAINIHELSQEINNLKVPNHILNTFTELIFIVFLEELFFNSKEDEDYTVDPPKELSNNNSVKITNTFNKIDFKFGQYPKIVVQTLSCSLSKPFVGNDAPDQTNTIGSYSNKSAIFYIPVQISILTNNYNEANMLANIIQFYTLANEDILRSLFQINKIDSPMMTPARKIKEYDEVYLATLQLNVEKFVNWSNMFTFKTNPKNLIYRLVGKGSQTDPDSSLNVVLNLVQDLPISKEMNESFLKFYQGS